MAPVLFGIASAVVMAASAQQAPASLSIQPLRDSVYLIKGGAGANCGLIVGRREAVVIDAKMTEESAKAMLDEIGKLTTNPVKRLILTHSDGDHVNGLGGFPKDLTIVAHPNTRKDMEEAFKDPKLSALAAWLPNELVEHERDMNIEGVRMRLMHFGPAHTQGDLVVYLPAQRIAFVGDLIFIGREPLIHRHKNGSSFGVVNTLKKLLELDADTFVSGHADPVGKDQIRESLASLQERQEKIRGLIAQGKTLEEIKAAFGVTEPPAGQRRRPGLVEVIYLELTEKK